MMSNRHRVLVISNNDNLRGNLVTLLSGYGYFVEEAASRVEGIKKFRAHKQSILIVDFAVLRQFTNRLFKLIKLIQRNAIVLIAAQKEDYEKATQHLSRGAFDILNLPLKTSSLFYTIVRAQNYHQTLLENLFVKNVMFFGLLLVPVWVLALFLVVR